ncbi:MAG: hypothetical protein ACAI44_07245 [Candidatus Sericytochromatia bacterium]
MLNDQQILADLHTLPPDKQVEVIDFIQFLKARTSQPSKETVAVFRQPPPELRASVVVKGDLLEPVADQDWESAI